MLHFFKFHFLGWNCGFELVSCKFRPRIRPPDILRVMVFVLYPAKNLPANRSVCISTRIHKVPRPLCIGIWIFNVFF